MNTLILILILKLKQKQYKKHKFRHSCCELCWIAEHFNWPELFNKIFNYIIIIIALNDTI